MIPNNFGLQRHPEADMFALPFPNIGDLSNTRVEQINPEWQEDKAITTVGGVVNSAPDHKCAFVDVSAYDYVILPCSRNAGVVVYTGMGTGSGNQLIYRITPTTPSGNTNYIHSYLCMPVMSSAPIAGVSVVKDSNAPIIGIKIS